MACSKPIPDETDEDHLTDCGICLSEIENPKALPCLHSFCLKCLRKVKHPPGVLTCPLCQENFPLPPGGVDGFRDNFFINQLKDRRAIQKIGGVKMTCSCCGALDREVVARCMDCNGFLCQQCVNHHKTMAPLKVHTVITLEELRAGKVDISKMTEECCQKHKDQVLRWFCKTCGIPICRDCTVMEHSRPEHDYVTLESATEGQMAEIKKLVANCKGISKQVDMAITEAESIKMELDKQLAKVTQQLQDAMGKTKVAFLKALDEDFKSSTDQLNKIKTERYESIATKKRNLQNLQSKINNAMEIANQVTKSGSKYDVASNYSSLSKTLSKLQEMEPHNVSKDLCWVKYKASQESIVKSVNLGLLSSKRPRVGNGEWVLEKEIGKGGNGKLVSAFGVAISQKNDILVADFGDNKAKVFNFDGNFKHTFAEGNLLQPHDFTVGSNGQYFVTNRTSYVKVYNPEYKYLMQFPVKSPNGTSSVTSGAELYGLAKDNASNLLVGSNQKYISKHKQDGTHISSINVGYLPWFMCVTSQGNIIITPNKDNKGVQVLDHTGNLLHTINAPKDVKKWCPCGVCCSDDNNVYINSRGNRDHGGIYSFTEEGKYMGCITTDVIQAEGMALTEDNKLVVAQCAENPVKIFLFI